MQVLLNIKLAQCHHFGRFSVQSQDLLFIRLPLDSMIPVIRDC